MTHGVAIVGAGRMARVHASAWEGLGVPVRWVVAPRASDGWADGAVRTTRMDAALADPSTSIVSICSPTAFHARQAEAALRAGKHVLLEKPIALSLQEALRLEQTAATAHATLMVAHVVRFDPAYAAVADRLTAGAVGRPLAVQAARLSAEPRGADWLHDESRSGGSLVDFAIHDIDQANMFLGEPTAVTSRRCAPLTGRFGQAVTTTIEYRGGAQAQVLSAADLPTGVPFRTSMTVVGDAGVVTLQPAAGGDPYDLQAAYFLACVEQGVAPERAPIHAAVLALHTALAARESLRTGRRTHLSDPRIMTQ